MSSFKKKGLGRGLSALFGDQKKEPSSNNSSTQNNITKANIGDLSPNKFQPRVHFNEKKLEESVNFENIKKKIEKLI